MRWLDEATWAAKISLDGWVPGSDGEHVVTEPATGAELGTVGLASPDDVQQATDVAVAAQREWAARPYTERAAVLRKAGDLWHEHAAEITEWIVRESGGIPAKAELEIEMAAQECYEAAALASQPIGEVLRSNQDRLSLSRRLPVGVVGVIAPFNFPLILSIRAVAPALALGNAALLKPDPRTAVCGGVTLARVFEEAGLPRGLLGMLPGGGDIGAELVSQPRIPVLAFTGSTAAGRKVGALAGQHLKRVNLELGGNSALIVLDDVDVEKAVSLGAFGSFLHQGQICMTTGRHLVDNTIVEDYTAALTEHAQRLEVGDPWTQQVGLGPIIDAHQRDHIESLVTGSVRAGARLRTGGTYDGLFYRPTVLSGVSAETPAYAEEVFGPVAPVAGFDSLDEAVTLAASDDYGLSLGIVSADGLRALELAARIPSGAVHINDQTVSDEAVIPFGGVKASGNGGRAGGVAANLDAYTDTQWVTARSRLAGSPF